jgi:hypothetical protein
MEKKYPPYLFIYPGLWRDYKIAAYRDKIIMDEYKDWADFRIVPAMTVVDTGNIRTAFLSSNFYPQLQPTLVSMPYSGKNTMASLSKYSVQTFGDPCAVSIYLVERGWELTSGIVPVTPYEIADIERIANAGQPKWEEKIDGMRETKKSCEATDWSYLF